ncbi:395_t:CDS:2, partial [Scutellospora calospora]
DFDPEPKTELYDQLQDNFYYGDNDDETIISVVLEYIKSKIDNNIKLIFDEQNLLVFYELQNQFETEVKDETYRRMGIDNPDIVNLEEFNNLKEEVKQAKLRRTCKLFNDTCSHYDINEVNHGFYEFVKESKVLIYRFKLTEDKKYVWIKNGDRMEKRELFRNKEVNYCCGGVGQSSIFIS